MVGSDSGGLVHRMGVAALEQDSGERNTVAGGSVHRVARATSAQIVHNPGVRAQDNRSGKLPIKYSLTSPLCRRNINPVAEASG